MKQYLDLLREIKRSGTYKPPAREGMPGTQSLFGYQFRHDLSEGFPLLTTKKMFWKGIVTELFWFLRGDTNIKYLLDNGVNIWNEDAYNYYFKLYQRHFNEKAKDQNIDPSAPLSFKDFIDLIKKGGEGAKRIESEIEGYTLGDCGYQYGRVWRKWEVIDHDYFKKSQEKLGLDSNKSPIKIVDQISNLINRLRNNPESRRHIITAIDPGHEDDLALYWCHAMVQFNCRPMSFEERKNFVPEQTKDISSQDLDVMNIPKYYLDCHLYQRSGDAFLGVPFNIASYALLTHIIAKMCNMVPGHFIHTFGDVHIYENHMEAVEEQLSRTPRKLPKLKLSPDIDWGKYNIDEILDFGYQLFELEDYNPYPKIKGELSTGLKKI